MKRFTLALLAAALPLAPRSAQAQVVRLEMRTPLMPMPGGHLPKSPMPSPLPLPNLPSRPYSIPTFPGKLPTHFEFLPNFGTLIPGVHLPDAGVPVRMELAASAMRGVRATPIAAAATRAEHFEKTLSVLRETFGLNDDDSPKTGPKAESIAGAFDGPSAPVRARVSIPERELERDLGVK